MKTTYLAVAIGTAITFILFGMGYVAAARGADDLSYALYWQAYLLYQMLPCSAIGSSQDLLCESVTAGKVTFYAGLPVGIAVYSLLARAALRLVKGGAPRA